MNDGVYRIALPWPRSVNNYWLPRRGKVRSGPAAGKVYIGKMLSPEALAFRAEVLRASRHGHVAAPRLTGRLSVFVYARPPEIARRRDLDNLWKCLLDALVAAEIVLDDALFDDERIVRGPPIKDGAVGVAIAPFDWPQAYASATALGVDTEFGAGDGLGKLFT